jgi:hypothetical protein
MRNTVAKDDSAHARGGPPKARKVVASTKVTKLAVSFPPDLAVQVWKAAQRTTKGNLSAWLAEAARNEMRRDALTRFLAEYEAEHGAFTEKELAASRKRLGWE